MFQKQSTIITNSELVLVYTLLMDVICFFARVRGFLTLLETRCVDTYVHER